jgi:hypothetical protein
VIKESLLSFLSIYIIKIVKSWRTITCVSFLLYADPGCANRSGGCVEKRGDKKGFEVLRRKSQEAKPKGD